MAPKKTLSWEEWQKKANASYVKGEYGVQQMVADWGYPEGMSADTHKIEFDKGKVKRKDRAARRAQRTSYNQARKTRIESSKAEVNKAIRIEATNQWDELVGDRNASIKIGNRNYTFDQYLNKEVRDHTKLTKQKAVEAVDLGKSLGHGTPTTDVGRYAESYTQQFAEDPLGNYATQDYIPPDQQERLKRAGLATSPQEAAQLHVGTTKIGGRVPDPEIEAILKLKNSGGTVRLSRAGSVLPLAGVFAGVLSAGQAFAAGDTREGTARLLESGAGEIPIAGDIIQPDPVAGGTLEDAARRTAEGIRAKQLQKRAAEARQRGGKFAFQLGKVRLALPEFGLSELMGIN